MDFAARVRLQLNLYSTSKLRISMVCLGNICRSPMAAAVLSNRAAEVTTTKVIVDSAGTGAWHVGEGASFSSEAVWRKAGYHYEHRAQQFTADFFPKRDLILVMDSSNYENVINLAKDDSENKKIYYLRQFDPILSHIDPLGRESKRLTIPDPYGLAEQAFEKVLEMVEDSVEGLIQVLNGKVEE